MAEVVDQLRKLKEGLESELARWHRGGTHFCRVPIGPFTPNGNAAARRFAQDQRLCPANTPGFKDRETLAFQRVERMSNFCPSQRLIGNLGSSR
jgi:hypothetical protein